MVTLLIIILVLLFIPSWYIESDHIVMTREARLKTKAASELSQQHHTKDIIIGFLITLWRWIVVSLLISLIFTFVIVIADKYIIFYDSYKLIIWIFAILLAIGTLWYFYLDSLIKRRKQAKSLRNNLKLTQHIWPGFAPTKYIILIIWPLLLIAIPYMTMHITYDSISPFAYYISPNKYESNDPIFTQILQEGANTNAEVRTEIRYLTHVTYKTMLVGITSATVILGLLILYCNYRPRKDE